VDCQPPDLARRRFLLALLLGSLVAFGAVPALAKSGSGGNSGSGSGDSGGGDDGGSDDGGGDDDGGDDDSGSDDDDDNDDDKIREAVKSGEAQPLADVLALLRETYKGEIVHIGIAVVRGRYRYLIRMIDEQDRLIEIVVDAKSKRVLKIRGG